MTTYEEIFFTWVGNTLDIPEESRKGLCIYKSETGIWDSGLHAKVTNVFLENEKNLCSEENFEKIRIFLSKIGALFYQQGYGDNEAGPVNDDYYKALIVSRKKRISEDPNYYDKKFKDDGIDIDIVKAIESLVIKDQKLVRSEPKMFDSSIAYEMCQTDDEDIVVLKERYFDHLLKKGYTKIQAEMATGFSK